MRIPVVMMFIAAAALATDADARRRGGSSKSYRSYSSSSYKSYTPSYTPKGKPCGDSYIAADKTCHIGSSTARTAAAAAAGTAAVGAAGLALAADNNYYVSVPTLNVRSEESTAGKVLKQLKKGDSVHAYEISSGWVRISPEGVAPEWIIGSSLSNSKP
ncbi:SH3 domain-containing protein [Azotobacter salinestris]|uniref:SH3 domain-containing protein n=1 Tax=Azotobacter salinestris TaxID=69964 RepID=UPI001FCB88AF|nr:SH3 domain-containing protein [Azotobacter salinestris]